MTVSPEVMKILIIAPLAAAVIYFDVRYRRIPNSLVLAALITGFSINTAFGGMQGATQSLYGFGMAFLPMLLLHIFGSMGAGDVKLFGAVGAILGSGLVPVALILVVMLGGALAVYSMMRDKTVFSTLHGVLRIFVGILPGWEMPRFKMASDRRHTIPYGVAIMLGSLMAAVWFRA
jgi:prepilin peptidase CpaA